MSLKVTYTANGETISTTMALCQLDALLKGLPKFESLQIENSAILHSGGISKAALEKGTTSATNLSISRMDLSFVIDVVIQYTSLTNLRLSSCCIGNPEAELLANFLKGNHTIKVLDLSTNDFYLGPNGIISIANALVENEHVENLNLSGAGANQVAIRVLSNLIRRNSFLKELSITIGISHPDWVTPISKALPENHTLQELNISAAYFDDFRMNLYEITELFEGVRSNLSLQTISLPPLDQVANDFRFGSGLNAWNTIFLRNRNHTYPRVDRIPFLSAQTTEEETPQTSETDKRLFPGARDTARHFHGCSAEKIEVNNWFADPNKATTTLVISHLTAFRN